MELSQLTAYAAEKYHIKEEYKWENFQSFSVLCDPATGKWSVLLMRQWDGERGEMMERCDIKCGREVLKLQPKPYLSPPFQMRGNKWVGVRMGGDTEEEIVFRLFDCALEDSAQHGTVVLLDGKAAGENVPAQGEASPYGETAIPAKNVAVEMRLTQGKAFQYGGSVIPERDAAGRDLRRPGGSSRFGTEFVPDTNGSNVLEEAEKRGLISRGLQGLQQDGVLKSRSLQGLQQDAAMKSGVQRVVVRKASQSAGYIDAVLPDRQQAAARVNDIPEKLRQLKHMYHYTHSSFQQKCQDFYRQAKFMEDFEDDYPWRGEVYHFYPVYQDLRTEQLRGYFTWRTAVRRGEYQRISAPLAYIYVYELLNGIGADSAGDAFHKLGEFEKGYLESGIGSPEMIPTVRRWMLDYCVVNQIDPETAGDYVASKAISQDRALAVLSRAEDYADAQVFSALCEMTAVKLAQSPVMKQQEGIRLFAGLWRFMQRAAARGDSSFFNQCFGTEKEAHYFPLSNAVYRMPEQREGTEYVLNGSHRFIYRKGSWYERTYPRAFFDRERLNSFVHEADRLLRLYLKAGRSIKARGSGVWAASYIRTFLEQEEKARKEAAKPKIEIEFSRLAKIRQDAEKTCDSLLTEEERELEKTLHPDSCGAPAAGEAEREQAKAGNLTDIDRKEQGGIAAEESRTGKTGARIDGQESEKEQRSTVVEESRIGKTGDRIDGQESGKEQGDIGAGESRIGKTGDRIGGQESGKEQGDIGAGESRIGKTGDRIDGQKFGNEKNTGTEENGIQKTGWQAGWDNAGNADLCSETRTQNAASGLLNPLQLNILRLLMSGEDSGPFLAEHHLMPTIVADEINEALYDEIGDTAVECDGRQLSILEDYMEEIEEILGCF